MRIALLATVLSGLDLLTPAQAFACRSPPEPSELQNANADAIVLAQIAKVEKTAGTGWRRWVATATKTDNVLGSPAQKEFTFADTGPGSCGPGQPSLAEYWILYLKKDADGFRVGTAWPFWWARGSMDSRLQRLNAMLPLGIVRKPTAEESTTLDMVERMMSEGMQGKERARIVRFPDEVTDLSRYTRVYSRSSVQWLSVEMFRSRTPQRLVSDIREQGPTEASCKCKLFHGVVNLDEGDLRSWGRPTSPATRKPAGSGTR